MDWKKNIALPLLDAGTAAGNGLLFGFGPQVRGGIAALGGGDYAAERDRAAAQVERAKTRLGPAGEAIEFAAGMAGPGGAAVKAVGDVAKLGRNAVNLLTGKALAQKTGNEVAQIVGKQFGRAAPAVAKPAAVAAEQQVGRLAQVANALGAGKARALALTPVGKTVAKVAGAGSAATAAQDPESDWSKSISEFVPRIVRQAEENGPIGAVGAAIGGGLNVGYETAMAPFVGIPAVAGKFMRGLTDSQAQPMGPQAATPEQQAEMAAAAEKTRLKALTQAGIDKAVASRMSTPVDQWATRFAAPAAPASGKNPWFDTLRVALQNRLAADIAAAKGDPAAIQRAQNSFLQSSTNILAPSGAPYMMMQDEE